MTEDLDRIIAEALEAERIGLSRYSLDDDLSPAGLWVVDERHTGETTYEVVYVPRPISTDDYAALDALERWLGQDDLDRRYEHTAYSLGFHSIILYEDDEVVGSAPGISGPDAISKALVAWAKEKDGTQ